jgi:hypothetical protein
MSQKNRWEMAQCQHRLYSGEETCQGVSSKRARVYYAFRFEVDMESWCKSTRKYVGREIFFGGIAKECSCWALSLVSTDKG